MLRSPAFLSGFIALAAGVFVFAMAYARAQDALALEPGTVYYMDGTSATPLLKEMGTEGGRANYSAKVKGAHAAIRFNSGQTQSFKVCSVDPTRYKLYVFKSAGNARTLVLLKVNIWIGGGKSVASKSEVPVTVKASEAGCFSIETQNVLSDGEYGFSPLGSQDAFMFGIGAPKKN